MGGGKCLLYVGGWKRSAECGNGERIFWVWEEGSVCCMWEDGRGLLSVGTGKGSSGCGRSEVSAVWVAGRKGSTECGNGEKVFWV